jgi:hypothetical protein
MSEINITEADVSSFREKLDSWGASLTGGERAILQLVAARAFPHETDREVEGFATPFEIKDFSFGIENPTTIGSATGGAGAGKVKFNESTFGGGTLESLVGTPFRRGG